MTDDDRNKEKPTRKEMLEKMIGSISQPKFTNTPMNTNTIGQSSQATDVHLGDEFIDWLENTLASGGELYAETVFFETDESTYTIRADDGTVIIEKQDND